MKNLLLLAVFLASGLAFGLGPPEKGPNENLVIVKAVHCDAFTFSQELLISNDLQSLEIQTNKVATIFKPESFNFVTVTPENVVKLSNAATKEPILKLRKYKETVLNFVTSRTEKPRIRSDG